MGTTQAFFDHYRCRGGRALEVAHGTGLDDLYDAVIGALVAHALGYDGDAPIVVSRHSRIMMNNPFVWLGS